MFSDIVEEVISSLQPEDLPVEYIILAKVTDLYGNERIYKGTELEKFLNDPNRSQGVFEARVILNIKKIRFKINAALLQFFDELNDLISRLPEV